MIYTGSNEIIGIKLGNDEISGIYCGNNLIYPTTVTGWSVNPSSIEMERKGGTATVRITSLSAWTISSSESWITFSQNSGDSGRTSVIVTFGENETGEERYGTITATDGTNTSTVNVVQYACNPIVCAEHLGNTNNQGYKINSNFYLFDSGLTVVDNCGYDLTGIKSICHRWDSSSFYEKTPVLSFGNYINYIGQSGSYNYMGCYATLTDVNLSIPDVEVLHYCFGNDREEQVSQTLTSVTFTNTDKVRHIGDFCYYNRNLKEVHLGNLSNVTNFESNSFNSSNVSLTGFTVDALPNINLNVGWQYCPLSVDSLVSIFNALPTASGSRTVTIGSTNKNKLSAEQLAIATNKGWTVN